MAIPEERGESSKINYIVERVPSKPVIRNQWLTLRGSNFSGCRSSKEKVAGEVAAPTDDKQKVIAPHAYLEVAEAVAARVGTTLSGLVVHADEAAPHAHFQMPGYTVNGTPVSKVAKRQALRDIQTIAAEIMGRHAPGIERGKPRWQRIEEGETYADTIHLQAYEMRSRLPDDIEEAEADLARLNALIDTNLERLRKALDDLRKAINKNGEESTRAEKLRNRVAKYEQRIENAQAELRRITDDQDMAKAALAKLEARKAEATMDLNELVDAVAQKKRR